MEMATPRFGRICHIIQCSLFLNCACRRALLLCIGAPEAWWVERYAPTVFARVAYSYVPSRCEGGLSDSAHLSGTMPELKLAVDMYHLVPQIRVNSRSGKASIIIRLRLRNISHHMVSSSSAVIVPNVHMTFPPPIVPGRR
jgi:hypothetical protein